MRRIIVMSAATLVLASCGGDREGTFETEDGEGSYSVDIDDGDVSIDITGPDGEQINVLGGADVDVELPDGFSIYPGSNVVTSTVLNQSDGMGSVVVMTSDDSPEEMIAFYRAQAEEAGVDVSTEVSASGNRTIAGEGEDGLTFSFNASPNDDGATGQLAVGRGL